MAKEILKNITDFAANIVTWHDEMQIRFDHSMKKAFQHIVSGAAAIITGYDRAGNLWDKQRLLLEYRFAKYIHKNRKRIVAHKKSILGHFAIAILVAVGLIACMNYATGFEYSYNGKVLGYVKNQEDVIRVLDLVSDELSKEYGSNIKIDKDSDIAFRKTVVLDKEIDPADTVLKRLTYMSDMEAIAYAISIDGEPFVICESEAAAQQVLKNIQDQYLESDNRKQVNYEEVGFVEEVKIEEVTTRLANISSTKTAKKKIMSGALEETVYVVKKGDTYSEIFSKFDTDFKTLKKINPKLSMNKLMPGDKIKINNAVSALTVKTVEKSTFAEKVKYKTEYRESSSMYKGDEKVLQKGVNGKRVVTARLTRVNGEVVKKVVLQSETIKKSVKRIVVKGTKAVPKTAPTGRFIIPVTGYTLTSPFGWRWGRMHEGVDLACPTGTTIRASDGGTVVYAGWYSGYGLFIDIDHGGGIHTRYGHCNSINVSVGQKVYQGQKIGEVGNTGNSYGSHCHFEITVNGRPVDPFSYTG
ncbi:murein DD-endopeptidase MepM/ murein hydrolase activator NlpD [Clostridiales Family XIII bacterium PM5-7]